jgi:HK97 family phage portal protein
VDAEPARGVTWPGYPYGPSGPGFLATTSGVSVTQTSALGNMAVWACQRVLKATISGLPVDVVRESANGRKTVLDVQPMVVTTPSGHPSIRRRAWVGQVIGSMLMDGNIYCEALNPDRLGRPTQLETIAPENVSWRSGRLHVNGKPRNIWPIGDVWHVPASQFMLPGQPWAMSPTEAGKTSIGTGIAAEEFGARFFGDGAHPSSHIQVDDPDFTAEQAEAISNRIDELHAGRRRALVTGSDVKIDKLTVDPKDGQFLELLQFEVSQACRLYGVPPSMVYGVMAGQAITYQNVTDSDLMFLKYSIAAWVVDLEEAWSELIAPQRVKFNVDAILRMDATRRWELHDKRLANKTTTVNAVRLLEDEEPFDDPEFDKPGVPGVDGARHLSAAEAVQKVYLGVGSVVTSDEARQIVNLAGGSLDIPGGIEKPAKPVAVAPPPADAQGTAS